MTDPVVEESSGPLGRLNHNPFSRRLFLRTGTLGALTAGLLGSVPGLSGMLSSASAVAPEVAGSAAETDTVIPAAVGPIVAHVIDASTGDVSLYIGEREIVSRDPVLVQHLLSAAR